MHFPVFAILATLPLLTTALGHGYRRVQGREVKTEVVLVTQTVYTTMILAPTPAIIASKAPALSILTVSNPTTVVPIPSPSGTTPAKPAPPPPNPYIPLASTPNNVSIVNSCEYDVWVSSVGGHESCGPGNTDYLVRSKSIYTEAIRVCNNAGVSLKVAKTVAGLAKPMQFEYTVGADKKSVSYDISYLDCMVKNGTEVKDFSGCVGQEKGIQAAGGKNCKEYHCVPGVECAQLAYTEPEFGGKENAPVGTCGVDGGVAFEICAENRK
ncbi:hypothetical protein COCMIDRAFT_83426 [Bipolaris oryzae ATCC 44560]|uniref:Uncharacterized protein n=1 Tax=Bipolaris oryzae ATCC 44560 TaxID=930090 RepID=W6ZQY2_COCMI|nr:uncharacterized protein COCMIDRAFT_83426 [Bipolaris oryzae ATCC 44560]EUC49904.1 hypothetical protein COCMIDRAFT_83426 [Bipolaris oryzae ATCC 44560]